MPYETTTFGHALQQVADGNSTFYIPAMQRPYVWGKPDIVKLFTSIYLGFPVGTSLIWPTTYDNPDNLGGKRVYFVQKLVGHNAPPHQANLDQGREVMLVLDGQQRLTSLNVGVRGHWVEGQTMLALCFNPALQATPALYEAPAHGQAFKFIDWDNQQAENLIRCSRILTWHDENAFELWLTNYLNMYGNNRNIPQDQIESNIRALRRRFWEEPAYCYGVYRAQDERDALNVFELSNDSGKSLDKTDIILARLQIAWSNFSIKEAISELFAELNQAFPVRQNPFNRKNILTLFFLTSDLKIPSSFTLRDFDANTVESLRQCWPNFVNHIKRLVNKLNSWGMTKGKVLSSVNAILPILYWQIKNDFDYNTENLELLKEVEKIREWLLITLLSGSFSGQSARTVSAARNVIEESPQGLFPKSDLLHRLEEFHNFDFTTEHGVKTFIM